MRVHVIALQTWALCTFVQSLEAQPSAVTIYQRVSQSVFLIETDQGGGTGFCISSAGLVATALHVVDGAKKVSVRRSGLQQINAEIDLVRADAQRDLAILKLSRQTCVPLALGDSDVAQPGEKIFVLGNPLARRDLTSSITDGLISGVRHLEDHGAVLQISAPLSPGNSGGPVLDETGRTLGIVAFKLTEGELLNFAIPVNDLKTLWKSSTTLSALFSWNPQTVAAYQSTAYRLPDPIVSIFLAARSASGTCQLKDASWTSHYLNRTTLKENAIEHIERRDFGSIETRPSKDATGRAVTLTTGKSVNGRWAKVDGKTVVTKPLAEDDIVNHLVDNWYCFCPATVSLWRDVRLSEEVFIGQAAYRVQVKEPFFGAPITFWFSKQSHLVIGREYLNKSNSGPVVIQDQFTDFGTTDGFTVPLKKLQIINGVTTEETVTSFRANTGYPDYMFEP